MSEPRILPKRLRAAREQAKKTLQEVADYLGVARSTYHGYESGYRTPVPEQVVALARFLGTSTGYLMGETDDPTPPGQAEKTPEERLREAGIEVWLRGEGLTEEDAELIKAVMESLRKRREKHESRGDKGE